MSEETSELEKMFAEILLRTFEVTDMVIGPAYRDDIFRLMCITAELGATKEQQYKHGIVQALQRVKSQLEPKNKKSCMVV